MKPLKNALLLTLALTLTATTVFAGGTIFGRHHGRAKNTDGINSIGVHICGTLTCPDVVIRQGSCEGVEHATMQYGVCMCEEGYHVENDKCVPKNPQPEGECPENADCSSGSIICNNGYYLNAEHTCGVCPGNASCSNNSITCHAKFYLKNNECLACPANSKTCDSEGHATSCEDGYYPKDNVCLNCPDEHATKCDGEGKATECESGYAPNEGVCQTCDYEYICDEGCCDLTGPEDACGKPTRQNIRPIGTTCPEGICNGNGACYDETQIEEVNCVPGFDGKWCMWSDSTTFCSLTKNCCSRNGTGCSGACIEGVCTNCPVHATACDGAGNATSCEDGYYLYYNACQACPEHATTCDSEGYATNCEDGYYIEDGLCAMCYAFDGYCHNGMALCSDNQKFASGSTCEHVPPVSDSPISHTPPDIVLEQCKAKGLIATVSAGYWECGEGMGCVEGGETIVNNDHCVCADGYGFDWYGECKLCPENADCSSGDIVCNEGFEPVYDGTSLIRCDCPEGSASFEGTCVTITPTTGSDGEPGCRENSDCNSWCTNEDGCYCKVEPETSTGNEEACYAGFKGTCAIIQKKEGYNASAVRNFSWWSAVNFCKALGASLPTEAQECEGFFGESDTSYWLKGCSCEGENCTCTNNSCQAKTHNCNTNYLGDDYRAGGSGAYYMNVMCIPLTSS